MDLLRHWRRRTFGAAAGALVAPAAIVLAALAVGVGGGGLGGLSSIGQTVSGPTLPAVAPPSARRGADDAGKLLARVRPNRRRARSGRPGPSAPVAPSGGAGTAPAAGPGGGAPSQQQTSTTRPSTGSAPPAATAPNPTPPPVATEPPTPLSQVGDTVKSITDQVPVAGQPAGQVVDILVDTVDSLPPRRPAPTVVP